MFETLSLFLLAARKSTDRSWRGLVTMTSCASPLTLVTQLFKFAVMWLYEISHLLTKSVAVTTAYHRVKIRFLQSSLLSDSPVPVHHENRMPLISIVCVV